MVTQSKDAGTRKETKKTKAQILKERRKTRGDLGSDRDVMRTPEVPGMVMRWVNDELKSGRNRVQRLRSLGWEVYDGEFVQVAPPNDVSEANTSLGDGAMIAVGLTRENKPMHAILMMIPQDIYEADQEIKEEAIRAKEETIFEQGSEAGMYGGVRVGTA
jgi:hypothetical protein